MCYSKIKIWKIGVSTKENSAEVPQKKKKNRVIIWLSNSTPGNTFGKKTKILISKDHIPACSL